MQEKFAGAKGFAVAKDFATVHRKIAIWVTVGVVVIAAAVVAVFFVWKGKTSTNTVSYRNYTVSRGDVTVGTTESGTVALDNKSITFPVQAEVSSYLVKSGQVVKKGDPLVQLDLTSVSDNSSDTKQKLEAAQTSLQQALNDQKSKLEAAQITYESSKYLAQSAPVTRELTEQQIQNDVKTAQAALAADQKELAADEALQKSWPADYQKLQNLEKWMNDAKASEDSYQNQLSAFNSDDSNSSVISRYNSLKTALDNQKFAEFEDQNGEGDGSFDQNALDSAQSEYNQYYNDVAKAVLDQQSALEASVAEYTAEYNNYSSAYNDFNKTYTDKYKLTGTDLDDKVASLKDTVATDQYNLDKAQKTASISSMDAQTKEETDLNTASNAQSTYDLTVNQLQQAVQTQQEAYNQLQDQMNEITNAMNGNGVIVSPCDGTVAAVSYTNGSTVQADQSLLTVSSTDSVSLAVSISEDDITQISIGQQASITLSAYDGQTFGAQVDSITAEPARSGSSSVTYTVVVDMTDASGISGKIYQGMSGEATIIQHQVQNVLYVSNRAITFKNGVSTVQVRGADGNPQTKTVRTGFSDGTNVEITSGLSEGDTVLVGSAVTGSAATGNAVVAK